MGPALHLARCFAADEVSFIVAGRVDCDEARALVALPNVLYMGEVSNALALASYAASDFVFTFYDPTRPINRMAESNKWGDAVKMGIGVIVNSEVETARYLSEVGIAVAVRYADESGLCKEVARLLSQPNEVGKIKARARALAESEPFFEDRLEQLFDLVEAE
jgi:hypothetical protein